VSDATTLRTQRDTWLWAARDARLYPHAELAPRYVARARQINRALVQLAHAGEHQAVAPVPHPVALSVALPPVLSVPLEVRP
jgi:hypothetical protein